MRHGDHGRWRGRHERLEQVEPGEVEVVGGLVEEQHVLARQEDRGQRGPGRLPAGEVADLDVDAVGGQADLGEHRAGAGVEVVATDGEEVLEGARVGLDRVGVVAHRGRGASSASLAAATPVRRAR